MDELLAPDYVAARTRFLNAAGRLGLTTEHHVHPGSGPDGHELAIDTAWAGPTDATSVLVVVSGTHGVEGFAGSYCQSRLLEALPELGDGVAVLFIHAFNPYGFAWVRRVNEDNVDINRNFVDFADPPVNPGYEDLHEAFCPTEWTDASRQRSSERIIAYVSDFGMDATQEAITRGQYLHPDGLYYGGLAPSWSHRVMRAVWRSRLSSAERIGVLDVHTGLGPRGHGELMSHHTLDHPAYQRAAEWWGDEVTSIAAGQSSSSVLVGEWMPAAESWLSDAEVTAIAIEWGTVDMVEVGGALQADNWLHAHDDPRGPEAPAIKQQLRAAFAIDEADWVDQVWSRFADVSSKALTALAP
jgi:hypothetical protein